MRLTFKEAGLLVCAAVCLVLATPGGAASEPDRPSPAYAARMQQVSDYLVRIGQKVAQTETFSRASDPEDMLQRLDRTRPNLERAIAEVRLIRQGLDRLEPLAERDVDTQTANQIQTATERYAEDVEKSLLLFTELRKALAVRDSARAQALIGSINANAALMLEGGALSARARAELFPRGQSQAHQARAHAATMEGASVILSLATGRISTTEAVSALDARVAEGRSEIRLGRAALEREVEATPDVDPALLARVLPLQRKSFDELETGIAILARAAAGDAEGRRELMPLLNEYNQSQQRLGALTLQQSQALQ